MKNSIALKFLAIVLCAAFLLSAVVSGIAVVVLGALNLYSETLEEFYAQEYYYDFRWQARKLVMKQEALLHSNVTEEELEQYYLEFHAYTEPWEDSQWFFKLYDAEGRLLKERYDAEAAENMVELTYDISALQYPVILDREYGKHTDPVPPETQEDSAVGATVPEGTGPAYNGNYDNAFSWEFRDKNGTDQHYLITIASTGASYGVKLYLSPEILEPPEGWEWELLVFVYNLRYTLLGVLGGSLLLFAATLVYLCCAAGHKPKSDEIRPGGLNRIPLDLYLGGAALATLAVVFLVEEVVYWLGESAETMWLIFMGFGALGYLCCLLIVGVLFAFAAQVKMPGAWLLKHTAVGFAVLTALKVLKWCFGILGKGAKWIGGHTPGAAKKAYSGGKRVTLWLYEVCKKILITLWQAGKALLQGIWKVLAACARGFWRFLRRFLGLLPVTWQWLLTAFVMLFAVAVAASSGTPTLIVMACLALCMGIVVYSAHCFGTLLESTRRMGQGDLETKVDDKLLLGSFREYATHLNALAGVAMDAAKKQMRSERMKAELVTNVSHDIKTPLTSIINYVDLLQKTDSPEERKSYLEVLSRQANRLKKLIEDLMEMSKASTGNLPVELNRVDAGEAIRQALGEFSEKLEQAQIIPVLNLPQEPVQMTADGRLTWRVLSNLLSNAVKYAMPGTRLYIDLVRADGYVSISLKNISREPLNVSSDELMERFVRGDASRNTEGSGLGLNIARSLMELQKGQLELLVDGDLFKATLLFRDIP